jgi:hypothetical protein
LTSPPAPSSPRRRSGTGGNGPGTGNGLAATRAGRRRSAAVGAAKFAPHLRRQEACPAGPVRLSRDLPGSAPVSARTAGALADRDISQLTDACPAGADGIIDGGTARFAAAHGTFHAATLPDGDLQITAAIDAGQQ